MKSPRKAAPDERAKREILAAARKTQSHLGNVIAMIEDDRYCVDVLQQALAVRGLWQSVIRRVFARHLCNCFQDALCHGSKRDQIRVTNEMIRVLELADRS